jgi:exosortase C (VPDSG-CTERM-specific)
VFLAAVLLCFSLALWNWIRLAVSGDLYSHLPLIPFVVAYLVWLRRDALRSVPLEPVRWPATVLALGGAMAGVLAFSGTMPGRGALLEDVVFWQMLGVYLLTLAGGFWFFGGRMMRQCLFPVLILAFVLPFPHRVFLGLQTFLQAASAEVSYWVLSMTGMPMLRDGFNFLLPGFAFNVAPECSGIRSTVVLFITSLVAGEVFLKSPGRRAILALIVVPLGVLRNTLRIFTISMLCVHVDPSYIHSPIHHRGGPLFFVVSLVPFFLILGWLRRSETRCKTRSPR